MRLVAVLTALAIFLVVGRSASAETKEDRDREAAREATRQATAAFNLGQYDEAATLYEKAYKLVSDPILLYDLDNVGIVTASSLDSLRIWGIPGCEG